MAAGAAIEAGGLTTAMELTARKRPFLFFPLRHHFEQNFHVRHRLERYGAGRCMDFETDAAAEIAAAIAEEIGREVAYRDVERATAPRAPRSSSPSCSDRGPLAQLHHCRASAMPASVDPDRPHRRSVIAR